MSSALAGIAAEVEAEDAAERRPQRPTGRRSSNDVSSVLKSVTSSIEEEDEEEAPKRPQQPRRPQRPQRPKREPSSLKDVAESLDESTGSQQSASQTLQAIAAEELGSKPQSAPKSLVDVARSQEQEDAEEEEEDDEANYSPREKVDQQSESSGGEDDEPEDPDDEPDEREPLSPEDSRALLKAAFTGDVNEARELLSDGSSPNGMDRHGWTPLHWAASRGHSDFVSFLLGRGAAVHRADSLNGWTALHLAAINGRYRIARSLLNKGASRRHLDKWGDTPFECAPRAPSKRRTDRHVDSNRRRQARDARKLRKLLRPPPTRAERRAGRRAARRAETLGREASGIPSKGQRRKAATLAEVAAREEEVATNETANSLVGIARAEEEEEGERAEKSKARRPRRPPARHARDEATKADAPSLVAVAQSVEYSEDFE